MKYLIPLILLASCKDCLECLTPTHQSVTFVIEVCPSNPDYNDFKKGRVLINNQIVNCH